MSATRRSPLLSVWLLLGYTFLYAPIVILIVFSFNESKLVTVWAGFSTKWYWELFQDRQMLMAAWLSLRLALMSATSAVALGVLAGLVMARFGRFRGHNLFASMITAPGGVAVADRSSTPRSPTQTLIRARPWTHETASGRSSRSCPWSDR